MRTLVSSLLAAAGLAFAAIPAAAQEGPKIAYIDTRAIIAQAPGAQEAQNAFEKEMAGFQSELKTLEDELQQMMSDYQKQQAMLSAEAKQQQQNAIREKQTAYQQRARELEQQAAQRQAELVQPVIQRINAVVADLREERGYAMIFDAAAGALIAADTTLNLTDVVLERLKASARQPS